MAPKIVDMLKVLSILTHDFYKTAVFVEKKEYMSTTIDVEFPNYTGKLNIIIHCQSNLIDSKIISVPTDFDGKAYHELEDNTLTMIYFESKYADKIYQFVNNWYRNINYKIFPFNNADTLIFNMALNKCVIDKVIYYDMHDINVDKPSISTAPVDKTKLNSKDGLLIRLKFDSPLDLGNHDVYILPKAVDAFLNNEKYDFGELLIMAGWKEFK